MAILKQNGVEGKILRAQQSGKVLKQNYNFGKGFFKGASTNCYVQCPDGIVTDLASPLSIIGFIDVSSTLAVNSDSLFRIEGANDGQLKFMAGYYKGNSRAIFLNQQTNAIPAVAVDTTKNIIGVVSDGETGFLHWNNLKNSAIDMSTFIADSEYKLYAGLGGDGSFAGYAYRRNDDFYVFDRKISDLEISYLWNNRLGNELLQTQSLTLHYSFDIFEKLPFNGGVDACCVRDESGNGNHGKIIGLPAGTVDEQVTYANDNLLV